MGNTVNNHITGINNIVSSSIINSLQTATTNLAQSQEFEAICDNSVINTLAVTEEQCWTSILPLLDKGQYTADDVVKICKPMLCIGNENITISGSIFAQTITELKQSTQTDITSQIANNIKSYVTSENDSPAPSILDTTANIVKNINNQFI